MKNKSIFLIALAFLSLAIMISPLVLSQSPYPPGYDFPTPEVNTENLGTCVNYDTGECTPNTNEEDCLDMEEQLEQNIEWSSLERNQISACSPGCCIINTDYGPESTIKSEKECEQMAEKYSSPYDYNPEIKKSYDCVSSLLSKEQGACVYEREAEENACEREIQKFCTAKDGKFYPGLLCTAEELNTVCDYDKPTTTCMGEDAYYVDSCGNLANMVDEKRKNDESYWTEIIEQNESCSPGETGCGNCETSESTFCGGDSKDVSCVDTSCEYKGETYSEGESWCVSDGGIHVTNSYFTKNITYVDGQRVANHEQGRELVENSYLEANLPGSRYYVLTCMQGEVNIEPCADYRNEVCVEQEYGGDFTAATCETNDWRECFNQTNKTQCEDISRMCKWIGGEDYYWGYRFDNKIYPWNGQNPTQLEQRNEYQGSCVPLYAPGFVFWKDDGDGNICSIGSVQEAAIYETGLFTDREDDFQDWSTMSAAHECFSGGCYAIPDYGLDSNLNDMEDIVRIHLGGDTPSGKLKEYHLSRRQGYYCPDKTGTVTGDDGPKCAEKESKRADMPIFLNHGAWMDYLQERAKSLGDCGYKQSVSGESGQARSETLSAVFQILDQDGELKEDFDSEPIYIGDSRYTPSNTYRGSKIFGQTDEPFYWRAYRWWNNLHSDKELNMGEILSQSTTN